MKHFNITVTGKVQGVFFRQSTCELALQLGLKGFVRNETNGDVYIEAEGDEEQLKKLMEWCTHGPARAEVKNVKAEEAPLKNFNDFKILR